jgi:hypothetical protein
MGQDPDFVAGGLDTGFQQPQAEIVVNPVHVTVHLRTGDKKAVATGPRRTLALVREVRAQHRVEPVVSDTTRTYSEADLRACSHKS